MVREMHEELGLKVRPVKRVWEHKFPDKPLTLFGWIAEVENGAQMQIDPKEIAEVFWMDAAEGTSHPDGLPTNRHFIACLEQQV